MKYVAKIKVLEENCKKRQALLPQIELAMGEFVKEKSSSLQTSERANVHSSNNLVLQKSQ